MNFHRVCGWMALLVTGLVLGTPVAFSAKFEAKPEHGESGPRYPYFNQRIPLEEQAELIALRLKGDVGIEHARAALTRAGVPEAALEALGSGVMIARTAQGSIHPQPPHTTGPSARSRLDRPRVPSALPQPLGRH
jgi:hypothetical protein